MVRTTRPQLFIVATLCLLQLAAGKTRGQEGELGPAPARAPAVPADVLKPPATERALPINLPTALKLAQARPIDVGLASTAIQAATAQLQRASVLWLPTIMVGTDYYFHTGQTQTVQGPLLATDKNAFFVGYGPYAVFAVTDAIFEPLAARQVLQAREAFLQSARNDVLLAVAESYFNVQQARGDLASAEDISRRLDELVRRVEKLAPGLTPAFEVARSRTELARRRQAVVTARARWRTSSAELARLLRLVPNSVIEPLEPPHLRISLLDPARPLEELIPLALTKRPELSAQQALVEETLRRIRQERIRPLVPSVLFRGAATQYPSGTLASGFEVGGVTGAPSSSGGRSDYDLQLLWQMENFGLGNMARVKQRRAENKQAFLQFLRTQDLVAAEVVRAHTDLEAAAKRLQDAEDEVRNGLVSVDMNFQGLSETRKVGNLLILVTRPQEAVAAVQSLAQAFGDYYLTVADFNRAQFRLYRALGQPGPLSTGAFGKDSLTGEEDPPACRPVLSVTDVPPPAGARTFGN